MQKERDKLSSQVERRHRRCAPGLAAGLLRAQRGGPWSASCQVLCVPPQPRVVLPRCVADCECAAFPIVKGWWVVPGSLVALMEAPVQTPAGGQKQEHSFARRARGTMIALDPWLDGLGSLGAGATSASHGGSTQVKRAGGLRGSSWAAACVGEWDMPVQM